MFLRDLFRYRTSNKKENREDFLSACLAELMRRDRRACGAILEAVGFDNLPRLDRYNVRTQVGRRDTLGKMRWCDVMVEFPGDAKPRIIECKYGDNPPEREQLRLYSKLWNSPFVALLSPEHTLPASSDEEWKGVPRGSWQQVWEAVERLKRPKKHLPYRLAVLDLMTHLDLEGCPNRSAKQMTAARDALTHQETLRGPMRSAVLALLADGPTPIDAEARDEPTPENQTEWAETGPLDAYWERDTADDGTGLEGLGLEVRTREGVGAADIDWFLSVSPDNQLREKILALSKNEPGWYRTGDWWERSLGDTGGPGTPFEEQLNCAVGPHGGQDHPRDLRAHGRTRAPVGCAPRIQRRRPVDDVVFWPAQRRPRTRERTNRAHEDR